MRENGSNIHHNGGCQDIVVICEYFTEAQGGCRQRLRRRYL